jgi:hypothetical protein
LRRDIAETTRGHQERRGSDDAADKTAVISPKNKQRELTAHSSEPSHVREEMNERVHDPPKEKRQDSSSPVKVDHENKKNKETNIRSDSQRHTDSGIATHRNGNKRIHIRTNDRIEKTESGADPHTGADDSSKNSTHARHGSAFHRTPERVEREATRVEKKNGKDRKNNRAAFTIQRAQHA